MNKIVYPPEHLINLITESSDHAWFDKMGAEIADTLLSICEDNQLSLSSTSSVLDFGCGCGRALQHLNLRVQSAMFGADYNSDLVSWCADHLPFAHYFNNSLSPPLDVIGKSFDLIYAISVFTHLPVPLQISWLTELRSHLAKDGLIIFSAHGQPWIDNFVGTEFARRWSTSETHHFVENGFLVIDAEDAGTNRCLTYHTPAFVAGILAQSGLELVYFQSAALPSNKHDMYAARPAIEPFQ